VLVSVPCHEDIFEGTHYKRLPTVHPVYLVNHVNDGNLFNLQVRG
jgi:hypothetical protein